MAVEVVGQDEDMKRRTTCGHCGAILEYYGVDVLSKTLYSFGDSELFVYITCPKCNTSIKVEDD